MTVIAVWVKEDKQCVLNEGHTEQFGEMVRTLGPPDGAFVSDWAIPVYASLVGVDRTNMKAIEGATLALADRMAQPPTCPHCGNHPYNCMGDDD